MSTHELPTSDRRDQLDLLITRIADNCASVQDWNAFSAMADGDAGAWKLLARAQRDQAALGLAVNLQLHAAERVELPGPIAARAFGAGERTSHRPVLVGWSRLGSAAGWVAAACLLLAWIGSGNFLGPPIVPGGLGLAGGAGGTQAAGLLTVGTSEDAAKAYVELGKRQNIVLGELPQRVVVDSRRGSDGQLEVIYIRQFVERARADSLVRFGIDERGNPVPVRVPMIRLNEGRD